MNQIANDTEDFGTIGAVRAAKARANRIIETFLVLFAKSTSSILETACTSEYDHNTPSK